METPPPDWGIKFTKTTHTKAEGPTDPDNIRLPPDFTVLITGAGKGLGWHIARAFAKAGATNMIVASRTRSDLEKLTEELKKINEDVNVLARTCDTMKEADVLRLAGETQQNFDRLDVAIANAGIISKYLEDADGSNPRLPVGIVEDTDFERVIETNLVGSYRIAKHFLPLLARSHQGPQSFVVITSMASHCADSTLTPIAYNLSKIANNRMAESIHGDHFDKDGVVAFAVHPGGVVTPQTELHNKTQRGVDWDKRELTSAVVGHCEY